MAEHRCGNCFWFTKADNSYKFNEHYCKLHYMQEARRKKEKACGDFQRYLRKRRLRKETGLAAHFPLCWKPIIIRVLQARGPDRMRFRLR